MTVEGVDYMGAESLLRVRHGDVDLLARVNGRSQAQLGETLKVSWHSDDMHVFDANGQRPAAKHEISEPAA